MPYKVIPRYGLGAVWDILTVISGYIQVGRDLTPTSPPNVRTFHTGKSSMLSNTCGQRQVTVSLPVRSHCTAVFEVSTFSTLVNKLLPGIIMSPRA